MPRPKNSGKGFVYQRKDSPFWWVSYVANGKRVYISSKSTKEHVAERFLRAKLAQRDRGELPEEIRGVTLGALRDLLVADYVANKRRSLVWAKHAAGRVLTELGEHTEARTIGPAELTKYVAARLTAKAANATINRELAALRRMFRLGVKAGKLDHRPDFSLLREDNARKGFVERPQLDAILARLEPAELRAPALAGYLTGWRVASELLTRQWQHVDLGAGWLRLEPGETKNGRGRMFPFTPELRALLEAQRDATRALQAQGVITPWVFFYADGRPIPPRELRDAWGGAARAAGHPGKLVHDLRRSAVRNMERDGVPRSAAMAMVGHETEAMYRRYAIVDEAMLREAAQKMSVAKKA